MTEKEKEDNPTYQTTGGYLKSYTDKEAWQKSYNETTEEDRKKIFNLPNFDADVFLEISGIDVRKADNQELKNKVAELEKQLEELKKQL